MPCGCAQWQDWISLEVGGGVGVIKNRRKREEGSVGAVPGDGVIWQMSMGHGVGNGCKAKGIRCTSGKTCRD